MHIIQISLKDAYETYILVTIVNSQQDHTIWNDRRKKIFYTNFETRQQKRCKNRLYCVLEAIENAINKVCHSNPDINIVFYRPTYEYFAQTNLKLLHRKLLM